MTFEDIECFIHLANCLNFTKAAEKVHISQTTMTRRISKMEEELNVQLFKRSKHHVALTVAGREFFQTAPRLLENYHNSVIQTHNAATGQRHFCVGIGSYEQYLLAPFLQRFLRKYPEIHIACLQYCYYDLLDKFNRNMMDVILTSDQFLLLEPEDLYKKVPIYTGNWELCLSRENALSESRIIHSDQLSDEVLITMNTGSTLDVRSYYHRYFNLRNVNSVNSCDSKLTLVNANVGVGLIPAFVDTCSYPNVICRDLEPPYHPRNFYAVCKKENKEIMVRNFMDEIAEYYSSANE
ncbi:putative LysR family transcriptional regulator [Oscillibacter valericigenes Sjm18-20]|nr:putative LysR family transcriptional regulator [Oscillibacter valericigenes Sjm18-20]